MLFRLGNPSRNTAKISFLVLDCDGIIYNSNRLKTAAYRATLANFTNPLVDAEGQDAFERLHLSDVSVSRWVKFRTFFTDVRKQQSLCLRSNPHVVLEGVARLNIGTRRHHSTRVWNRVYLT